LAGGVLAQSEWVFWEALGLIVGKLGVVALSTHTIPSQVIMFLCMVRALYFIPNERIISVVRCTWEMLVDTNKPFYPCSLHFHSGLP
jgi:hypothetical protein